MRGTFEIIAYKNRRRSVLYYGTYLYNGIANRIYDHMKAHGYTSITVRLMPC